MAWAGPARFGIPAGAMHPQCSSGEEGKDARRMSVRLPALLAGVWAGGAVKERCGRPRSKARPREAGNSLPRNNIWGRGGDETRPSSELGSARLGPAAGARWPLRRASEQVCRSRGAQFDLSTVCGGWRGLLAPSSSPWDPLPSVPAGRRPPLRFRPSARPRSSELELSTTRRVSVGGGMHAMQAEAEAEAGVRRPSVR